MRNYFELCKDGFYLDYSFWNLTDLTINSNWFKTNSVCFMCYGFSPLVNCNIDFWKGTSKEFSMDNLFCGCNNLVNLNVANWQMNNVICLSNMFYGCHSLSLLDVSNWNTDNFSDLSGTFGSCDKLTYLNVENWNVYNVLDISSLFYCCYNLTNLNLFNWNFKQLQKMDWTFAYCNNLNSLTIPNWDISRISSLVGTFAGLDGSLLVNILQNWDVKNVTNFSNTFISCTNWNILAPVIQNWNFTNARNIDYLFGFPSTDGLQDFSLINLNICNVNNVSYLFSCPSNLRTLNIINWKADNLQYIYGLVERGSNLQNLYMNNWFLPNLKKVTGCFSYTNNNCNVWLPNTKIKRIFLEDPTAINLTNIKVCLDLDLDISNYYMLPNTFTRTLNIYYDGILVENHPNNFSVNVNPLQTDIYSITNVTLDKTNKIISMDVTGVKDSGEDTVSVTLEDDENNSITEDMIIIATNEQGTFTIEKAPGAWYGFTWDSTVNGYKNDNDGTSTCAVCRLNFKTYTGKIKITCNHYSNSSNYNYGLLSNIDTSLETDYYYADNYTTIYKNFKGQTNVSEVITYENLDGENHFIDIKYRKSSGTADANKLIFTISFS